MLYARLTASNRFTTVEVLGTVVIKAKAVVDMGIGTPVQKPRRSRDFLLLAFLSHIHEAEGFIIILIPLRYSPFQE